MNGVFAQIASLFSPRRPPPIDRAAIEELIAQLEKAGFYKYTDSALITGVKAAAAEDGYLFEASTGRRYGADAESLAEGGVQGFMEKIRPFLERQGVVISSIEQHFDVDGYTLCVNGVTHELYSQKELETQEIWELTTRRAFRIINQLLEAAHSDERIYLLGGGHDGQAVFLTPEQLRIIRESPDAAVDEPEEP